MSKIHILNGAQPYAFAPGGLNATFAARARERLEARGHEVRLTTIAEGYDVEAEIESHRWADTVILQFPVNWMGVPWSFKRYMDEVYTAGMDGRLCAGDGRTTDAPKANYGMGGALVGTRYMISATFNAPAEAFDDPSEPFFEGMSMDDLLRPVHLNAKFFGMTPLPSFGAFDVMKNAEVASDLARLDARLAIVFEENAHAAA
ncbi:NAD(P)H-dependent oxidoreductase [Roseibacterium sp. SDUM158017]|uniref:NAD(P)H-dependent oxidoreductase n=1 Tax=Roseicyclus salinarum TaxID=3036773 RepID=UPI0024151626|nr:NAD(P)H-dependent oxidoreductase [Roseibacterium sp. SDUM158017]MDG4647522.1 NAD(P)H-dependent oxidoreductase [Roseibacterium sp. SDUM158017]